MPTNLASFVWMLPKAELHLHLDTSLRPATALELALARKIPLNSEYDLIAPEDCGSLINYLKHIDPALAILQDTESLERCASELAEDLISDGVLYAEVRFAPELHTKKGLKERQIMEAVWRGFRGGQYKNLRVRIIWCAIRHLPLENAIHSARQALACRDLGVVAFDLAGDESAMAAATLKDIFQTMKREQMHITVHAGEARGPESVWEALDLLGAQRIGHGVRSIEDPKLVERLAREQIPLENCPTSNVLTGAVKSMGVHPAAQLLRAGVKVTINTDARTTAPTTLTDEYVKITRTLDLSREELLALVRNGFEAGFDVGPDKARWLKHLQEL